MYLLELLYTIYAILAGYNDAILYSGKGAEAFKWNEHVLFVAERLLIVSLPLAAYSVDPWRIAWAGGVFVLTYSFLHNTTYYYARNQIDGTTHNPLTYQSASSTAKDDYSARVRIVLAALGVLLHVVGGFFLPR